MGALDASLYKRLDWTGVCFRRETLFLGVFFKEGGCSDKNLGYQR